MGPSRPIVRVPDAKPLAPPADGAKEGGAAPKAAPAGPKSPFSEYFEALAGPDADRHVWAAKEVQTLAMEGTPPPFQVVPSLTLKAVNRKSLARAGAIPLLVELLRAKDVAAAAAAAGALWNLAADGLRGEGGGSSLDNRI
jgi:hypothetical protein